LVRLAADNTGARRVIPEGLGVPTTGVAALSSSGGPVRRGFQQSLSLDAVQPVGQHESRAVPEQAVIGTWRQAASQVWFDPVICSAVQGSPSSGHRVGHVWGGSQVSPAPTLSSPQVGEQSSSLSLEQPAGQQPSFEMQAVMGAWLHVREQPSTEPAA
jgi:hypothetical protein